MQPYLVLAEQLGSFAGQLTETGIAAVTIAFEGHVAGLNTQPLVAAVLSGLLRPMLAEVNMVSAPILARERNISVTETKNQQHGDYETLIRLSLTTERQTRSVAGTLFGGDRVRIVEIKEIGIEAALGPHMLYLTNNDKPGVIGDLGRSLSDAGVNIATFHLGRAEPSGDAIALLQIDQPLDPAGLKVVRGLPNVIQVKPLAF